MLPRYLWNQSKTREIYAAFCQVFKHLRASEPPEDASLDPAQRFHGSGVATRQAIGGEIGVTAFNANTLSGYVDLEFPEGPAIRGTFIAAWQPRQQLCG